MVGRGGNDGNNGNNQRPPGDLGGMPGGKRSDVFQDAASGREPGDLGGVAVMPASPRPAAEERQRSPTERVIERPRKDDATGRPQIRATEEVPARVEVAPVEAEAPGRVQRRSTDDAVEPKIEAKPAPRERGVDQTEIPR